MLPRITVLQFFTLPPSAKADTLEACTTVHRQRRTCQNALNGLGVVLRRRQKKTRKENGQPRLRSTDWLRKICCMKGIRWYFQKPGASTVSAQLSLRSSVQRSYIHSMTLISPVKAVVQPTRTTHGISVSSSLASTPCHPQRSVRFPWVSDRGPSRDCVRPLGNF